MIGPNRLQELQKTCDLHPSEILCTRNTHPSTLENYVLVLLADPDHKVIKKDDFPQHMALLRSDMEEGFKVEYETLDLPEWEFTQYNAKVTLNKNKNRYINIIPCESC